MAHFTHFEPCQEGGVKEDLQGKSACHLGAQHGFLMCCRCGVQTSTDNIVESFQAPQTSPSTSNL